MLIRGGAADAYPEGNASHHGHHRAADAGSRQGDAPHVGDVSYIHTVHNAVKDADELGQHTGDGNAPYKPFYIVTTEIIFQGHFLFLRKFCMIRSGRSAPGKGSARPSPGSATQYITRILENVNREKGKEPERAERNETNRTIRAPAGRDSMEIP